MVERPIKKSERQHQTNSDSNSANSDSAPSIKSNPKSSNSNSNRSSGKKRKESSKDGIKQQVNPALARGPKPAKAPVIVKTEPETNSEEIVENSQDEQSQTSNS